jgi:hypothetical protein
VKQWASDEELLDTLRRDLFTAVVGDVMDTMGLLHQFLPPQIKPLSCLKHKLRTSVPRPVERPHQRIQAEISALNLKVLH